MTPAGPRELVRPLTSLRFLAALWVLLHHALPRGEAGSFADTLAASGWLGVSLFFVLSGFLLTVRYAPDGAMRGERRRFYLERVARLAPTYALSLLFAAVLFARDARVGGFSGGRIAAIVASVVSGQQAWRPETSCEWNCPAWSLSVEMWFYIAFPFVIAAVGAWMMRHGRVLRGLALLAGSLVASAIIFPGLERVGGGWPLPVYSLSPLARWPEFLAGIGLAGMIGGWAPRSGTPGLLLLTGGIGWIVATVAGTSAIAAAGGHLLPVALPGFVLIIGGSWLLRGRVADALGTAPLVLLGEASYALYLFHAPLHGYLLALTNRLAGRGYDTSWTLFVAYSAAAIMLSVAIHRRFELPWRGRLRRRFGLQPRHI